MLKIVFTCGNGRRDEFLKHKDKNLNLRQTKRVQRAIATLEDQGGIRDNLLIAQQDLQFNFRDTISPLYREFAQLKLERAESLPVASPEYQEELDLARSSY